MQREEIAKKILRAHEAYFDIYEDYAFGGRMFAGYAEFHNYNERYVLSKRAALWEADSHEYLFIDTAAHLDTALVSEAVDFLKTKAISKVDPHPNHMSSNLSMIIVADYCDEDALRALEKTRYRKNFQMGIRGWSDVRIAAVDLTGKRVATNAAAKDMRPTLEANAGFGGNAKRTRLARRRQEKQTAKALRSGIGA